MATLRDDFYHLVPDAVVLRGLAQQRQMFYCFCCREIYQRGSFRCCAPPHGMTSSKWRELRCPECSKCARHCQCPSKAQRLGEGPLASIARKFMDQFFTGR